MAWEAEVALKSLLKPHGCAHSLLWRINLKSKSIVHPTCSGAQFKAHQSQWAYCHRYQIRSYPALDQIMPLCFNGTFYRLKLTHDVNYVPELGSKALSNTELKQVTNFEDGSLPWFYTGSGQPGNEAAFYSKVYTSWRWPETHAYPKRASVSWDQLERFEPHPIWPWTLMLPLSRGQLKTTL